MMDKPVGRRGSVGMKNFMPLCFCLLRLKAFLGIHCEKTGILPKGCVQTIYGFDQQACK